MDITDAQWAILKPWLQLPQDRVRGRPWRDARAVLNAVLWVLRTGAPWHDLPSRYPPYQTCHRQLRDCTGIELIAPHNAGRVNPPTQDGRPLRRYRRRWKVERLFAWLHNSRRLVTRWEYHAENFLAMLQLACALILLRHL